MYQYFRSLSFFFVTMLFVLFASAAGAESSSDGAGIPFPAALEAAAIRQERLNPIFDHSLILGNGDINGLLFGREGNLFLRVTKNDVWDARLDTSQDEPIPTLEFLRALGRREDWPPAGYARMIRPDGSFTTEQVSWLSPYPCPRPCATIVLGEPAAAQAGVWRRIRSAEQNRFEFHDGAGVMGVAGKAGASNGFATRLPEFSTDDYSTLRVRFHGSANARFYVDVMGEPERKILSSGWRDSPATAEEHAFSLLPGQKAQQIVLYAWTTDGQPAENHIASLVFEGSAGEFAVPLQMLAEDLPARASRLDLRRAVARLPETTVRALARQNVFLIESPEAARILPIPISHGIAEPELGKRGDVSFLRQELPGDLDWTGMQYAVALAQDAERKAVAVVTSFEAEDVVAAACELARTTLASEQAQLVARHEAIWERFWSASGIELDDPLLTPVWYRNLYFMRCVSGPGAQAVGLYASLVGDGLPAWHGGHTTNYNTQQTYWTPHTSNHIELAEPYERLITGYLPRARWLAGVAFDCRGAYFPHNLFAFEPDPAECDSNLRRQHINHTWGYTLGNSGFVVQNLWRRHKLQPDHDYLEQTAYPAVRDVALFYADFVAGCERDSQGRAIVAPTVSPEHWQWTRHFERNRNGTFCLAFMRYTLAAAIEGAEVLGRDPELVARFRETLALLPDYPTTAGEEAVVVDVEGAPPITYNIAVPAVPVFPAEQVTVFSCPEEQALFRRTIEQVRWNGNNSTIILAVARARLSMPDSREWLQTELAARSRPNGTLTLNRLGHGINNHGHYTEQFAAAGAVVELLLQSVGDIIRIFPAWPEEIDARFVNLRAQGGFLVSAERKEGRLEPIHVVSTAGGKLRVLSPWKRTSVLCPETGARSAPLEADRRGIITLDTRPGERIVLMQSPPE